jgi:hypothetical protein
VWDCPDLVSAVAQAKDWGKTDEYVVLQEALRKVCPTDGSLEALLSKPYPDEPTDLVFIFDGYPVGKSRNLSVEMRVELIMSNCEKAGDNFKTLSETKYDKNNSGRVAYVALMPVLSSYLATTRRANVAGGPANDFTLSSCGQGVEPSLRTGDDSLKKFNSYLAGKWVHRRVAFRLQEHLDQNLTVPSVVAFLKSQKLGNGLQKGPGNFPPIEETTHWFDKNIADCSAAVETYENNLLEMRTAKAEKDAGKSYDRMTAEISRYCGGIGNMNPSKNRSDEYEKKLAYCRQAADQEWQEKAESLASDPRNREHLDALIKSIEPTTTQLEAGLAQAVKNEEQCELLADRVHTRSNSLTWKKCMSNADLTSTAVRYMVTDEDLYEDFMNGKALSCASSTGLDSRSKAFYNGCVYAVGWGHLKEPSGWSTNEDVPSMCYELSHRNSLCIEEVLKTKYTK